MIADVLVVLTAFLAGGALVALVQHLRACGTRLDLDRLRRERDAAQRAADRRFDLLYDVATALDADVDSFRAATGLGRAYDIIDSAEMLAGACRWKAEHARERAARDVLYRLVVELGLFSSAHAFEDRVWGAARAPASEDEILEWILHAVRDGVLDRGNAGWVRERVLARTPAWRIPSNKASS